jgi:hypothetical protein
MTDNSPHSTAGPEAERPPYEPPRIVVHDEDSLAELIGPAVACARWAVAGSAKADADDED